MILWASKEGSGKCNFDYGLSYRIAISLTASSTTLERKILFDSKKIGSSVHSVTRQVPPNAPSLARNGLSVSSQWQQQSQLKPYLQHKQQNGPNQRGAPQTSPPSHGQTTYQVKQTVSHNTRVNVRSSTASVSAQIPKPRWPEDGLQTVSIILLWL